MESFIFMLRPGTGTDTGTYKFVYVSGSVTDVLGFQEQQIIHFKMNDLLLEEDHVRVNSTLSAAIRDNKAAILVYTQFLHARGEYVFCQMSINVAGNMVVGSIRQASPDTIGNTERDQSAEEVFVAAHLLIDHPGMVGYPALNWTGTRFPRTVLLLERFSANCLITHCTNNVILDNEACINQGLYRYIAPQDEASVRSFIASLRRGGLGANAGFVYHTFMMCVASRDLRASNAQSMTNEVRVSAVGSVSSDGFILVLKREH